jgi:hypothetical protein
MVTWDMRDPTPGMREWLEAIQAGDVINVHPRVMAGFKTLVDSIEVEVYCEA